MKIKFVWIFLCIFNAEMLFADNEAGDLRYVDGKNYIEDSSVHSTDNMQAALIEDVVNLYSNLETYCHIFSEHILGSKRNSVKKSISMCFMRNVGYKATKETNKSRDKVNYKWSDFKTFHEFTGIVNKEKISGVHKSYKISDYEDNYHFHIYLDFPNRIFLSQMLPLLVSHIPIQEKLYYLSQYELNKELSRGNYFVLEQKPPANVKKNLTIAEVHSRIYIRKDNKLIDKFEVLISKNGDEIIRNLEFIDIKIDKLLSESDVSFNPNEFSRTLYPKIKEKFIFIFKFFLAPALAVIILAVFVGNSVHNDVIESMCNKLWDAYKKLNILAIIIFIPLFLLSIISSGGHPPLIIFVYAYAVLTAVISISIAIFIFLFKITALHEYRIIRNDSE